MSILITSDIILQGISGAVFDHAPQITALQGGGFVVTWQSVVLGQHGSRVFVQQFDASGIMLGPTIQLEGVEARSDLRPQVATLKNGGFAVTWMGDVQPVELEHPADIFVQSFDSNGALAGQPIRLQGMAGMWDYSPQITALEDGGFVVTWEGRIPGVTTFDIFLQQFDAGGSLVGGVVILQGMSGVLHDSQPQITALPDGGYVIVWTGDTSDGHVNDVFLQSFDASGALVGGRVRLEGMEGLHDSVPQIKSLYGGGFAVTWQGGTSDGQSEDIFVQTFDADKALAGGPIRLQGDSGNQYDLDPQIVALAGGGFIVSWTGQTDDGQERDIFFQRFDETGTLIGAMAQLQGAAGVLRDENVQISALEDGGFVVFWHAATASWRGYDIFMQRFDAVGTAVGGMVSLQGAPGYNLDDFRPQVAGLDDGGFVVTWYGNTSDGNNYDIFIQRFDAGGQPISVNYVPVGEVTIAGTAQQGKTLRAVTSSIADADGLGNFSYQWFADGVAINGAIDSTFRAGFLQVGQSIAVQVSYTDRQGTLESLLSEATADVAFGIVHRSEVTVVLPENGYTRELTLIGGDHIDGTGNSLDNLIIGNRGRNTLYGGVGSDTLQGAAGNDTLDGGSGENLLLGGRGNDTYFIASKLDQIEEHLDEGTDLVLATISYTLGTSLENLTLIGSDEVNGRGNSLSNRITGNDANNLLRGGAGNDTLVGGNGIDLLFGDSGNDSLLGGVDADVLYGGTGDDSLFGDSGDDVLSGGSGHDALFGGISNDLLRGDVGNDGLFGSSGNDTLIGGIGRDTLEGGAGADLFVFASLTDSSSSGYRDTINDFGRGADRIDLSGIDANTALAGDQAFAFLGKTAFSGVAGQLIFRTISGTQDSLVLGDVDGDGTADFSVRMLGVQLFSAGDFVL